MGPPPLLMVALRGGQHREERQAPDALRPGNRGQEMHGEPAQSARLDEVALARPHRVAIDPFGCDLRPPAPFNRVIHPHHHDGVGRHEGGDQEAEQDPTEGVTRPARPVEHPMIILELRFVAEAHDAQDGGDGPRAGGQHGADDEDLGPVPDASAETTFEVAEDAYNRSRQR